MKAVLLTLTLALAFSTFAWAEDKEPAGVRYYADVDTPFYIGGSLQLPGQGFSLIPRTSGGLIGVESGLRYRPATQLLYGISARYKILGGGLTFSLPILGFQAAEGTSTHQDYGINYYGKTWGFELNYSDWTGYLIDGVRGLSGETYYLEPNLKNVGGGVVFYIPLSPDRYSLGAAFDQRQRQLLSAGSFFIVGSFRYQDLRSPVEIIPASHQADFGADATLSRSAMKSIAGGIGYGLHLVANDLFFSTALIAEVGHQWIDYTLASGPLDNTFIGVNGRLKVALGHNGKTLITGLSVNVDAYTEATRNTLIVHVGYTAQLFLGFRL